MTAEVATSSFLGDPQPVEAFHAGDWFPGDLLGWRFDETGTCRVRVRCVVGGLRHTAWTDLAHLRLPTTTGTPVAAGRAPERHADPTPAQPVAPRRAAEAPAAPAAPAPSPSDRDTGRHPLLPATDPRPAPAAVPRPRRAPGSWSG
ncbi:hypothetical protein [Geodermatophilus sabuli]|uniref:Uncharacterized protein n=1 Tax=Geodermatophilus sabuli TaxID=1564158 RepID=A0A285EGW4_9ACTN|nr:hypothetical protein [Geodermatophilus sabuli]MBB3086019.1 pyruvate/2-oxoglutarate dehydrogenase complex dihydrolipoamide acyltransferase (E2) component [Geodermatophilus sabuli]SNX98359.1 hypothetical protein SAMN06893097_110142 [Geodermatophilus sabuli]